MDLSAATADAMWVEVDRLYENRGQGVPGYELDELLLPRESRMFFGFSARDVPPNTILGEVMIQYRGERGVARHVRFADDSMDKLHLPVPLTDGPASYDAAYLLFTRQAADTAGRRCFQLDLGDQNTLTTWRSSAKTGDVTKMIDGRYSGFLWW